MAEKQPTNTNTLRGSLSATENADSHGGDGGFGGGGIDKKWCSGAVVCRDGDGGDDEGWRRCCRGDDNGGSGLVAATGWKSPGAAPGKFIGSDICDVDDLHHTMLMDNKVQQIGGARGRAYAIDGRIRYSVVSSRMNQLH
nr:hypothetical protein [Tanacetum cinerariifolium]